MVCELADEFPLSEVPVTQAAPRRVTGLIPHRCFQTAEDRFLGKTHLDALTEFRQLNADFEFLFYDANARNTYIQKQWGDHPISEIYLRARFPVMRADIFRYCIVFDLGGFYMDMNKVLVMPFVELFQAHKTGVISFEQTWCQLPARPLAMQRMRHPEHYVAQWGFGFAAKHPILEAMIANICEYSAAFLDKEFCSPSQAVRSLTGPGLFTQTVRDYFEQHNGDDIAQAGIDFIGSLRYPSESRLMYLNYPHYKDAPPGSIFHSFETSLAMQVQC
jgi:mannosyltransferase OCH1-like enzyme